MKLTQHIIKLSLTVTAIAMLTLFGCGKSKEEIIEDITPVVTAKIDGVDWNTKIAAGVNSTLFIITASKDKEAIVLSVPTKAIGVYPIDILNNIASYVMNVDSITDAYVAYEGEIDIESMNTIRTQVNGTFTFKAANANLDTISITNGTFINVPTK